MGMSKTKDMLIDVARRLFAESGKENTTMNDIAVESKKGRRTLYTYFTSKEDIYLAVIEKELHYLLEQLESIENKNLPADEKLKAYIFVRLDTFKEVTLRNGSLRASFFQNAVEVEKARRPIETKEIQMLKRIFEEGINQGLFDVPNPQWAAEVFLNMLKGLEKPYYKEKFYQQMQMQKNTFLNLILNGISKKK